ncbi:UBN2 domain-containing protein [Cephalotus follicularis]|uniref:UBN2 domain-containing protein n=1 Tax=Cephalotus follicularis TaxID=3775 RepID=A0A1Q3D7K0_CEPFO|nr:UBN2 domain-containing protein [Cephalotus follicularis]
MQPNESIKNLYYRLLDITNGLLGLGKVFGKDELVRKLLGCLNDEWEPKVTAIEESKDLKTMEIEELLGSLMTHEVKLNKKSANLVETKPQEERRKDKALKARHLSDDESSDDEVTEKVANLCFMALSDDEDSENEVDDSYTFGELQFAFDELLVEFKKKCSQCSSLKKNIVSIENEKDMLLFENEKLKSELTLLKNVIAIKDTTSCNDIALEKEVKSLKEKNVNL